MYLNSFAHFRGIAIIIIVTGHCYDISGWRIDTLMERVLANLITGGTTLFVFISGFLFHHVFYPRYTYYGFMKGKVKNVLIPYLFLSGFAIAQALLIHGPYADVYFGPANTFNDQVLRPALLYLLTGGVFAYWYIPFIMCIFALSPVFIIFIRSTRRQQLIITSLFLLFSLLLHRPVNNFLVPQSVLFFTPVYLIGILCSLERELLYQKLHNKLGLLLAATLFFAILQALTGYACGDLQKAPLEFNGIDLNLIQKLFFCLFLLVLLHSFEDRKCATLNALASASFAIYFLHGWFIYAFSLFRDSYSPLHGLFLLPFTTVAVILCSYQLARIVKKTFPHISRQLIGW